MAKQKAQPKIFLSYSSFDEKHEGGRLSALRKRLSEEFTAQRGKDGSVFVDRTAIRPGDNWKAKLQAALDAADVLVAFITPSYLNSPWCRTEIGAFFDKERQSGQKGVVVPIVYMGTADRLAQDSLGKAIVERDPLDWRELRFEPFSSSRLKREMQKAASAIGQAIQAGASDK